MFCPYCGRSNPSGANYCNTCGKQLPSITTSVRCPSCGADGQEYRLNCSSCGKELPRVQKIDPLTGASIAPEGSRGESPAWAVAYSTSTTRPCPICGRPKDIFAARCDYCSHFEPEYVGETYTSDVGLATWGGVLILIAGALGMLNGIVNLAWTDDVGYLGYQVPWSVVCCSGVMIIFGAIACAGSFPAFGRTNAVFAVVGGIFGIIAVGFILGAILAEIGIMLVTIGYDQFQE